MSDNVRYKGRIKKIADKHEAEATAKKIIDSKGLTVESYYDSHLEYIADERDDYLVVNGELYEVVEKKQEDPYEGVFNATPRPDGTIGFEVLYYNGGMGFEEAIEEAINRIGQ